MLSRQPPLRSRMVAGNIYEPLEPRIAPQSVELGLDADTRKRESPPLGDGALKKCQCGLRIAAQRVHGCCIVARKRIVGAKPHAALEALERDVERRLRLSGLAELQVRAAQPRIQLHEDPTAQGMVGVAQKIDFALKIVERLGRPSLQRRQMTRPDVASGNKQT